MITTDRENNVTLVRCENCGSEVVTDKADGVIPSEWMTGQLWLDVSMGEQKQWPICFCPTCKPHVISTLRFVLTVGEEVVTAEPVTEEPTEYPIE